MKKLYTNRNVLTAGVALALGITSSGLAIASTNTGSVSPTSGVQISNTATASYSVDGVAQTPVSSNAVIVNVSELGSFTLLATQGGSQTDDKNESLASIPGGTTQFTNKLTNTGNVTDTYTINLTNNNDSTITTGNQDYTFSNTSTAPISYSIKNADGTNATTLASGQTQTGTITSGGKISLLPGQYVDLSYSLATPTTQVGGQSGVGTITATSAYITKVDSTKATLINENQAIVKLPVFSIVKSATNTNINLNDPAPTIDYSITVKNDGSAPYAADAVGVLIQDKLPKGLTVQGGTTAVTVSSTDGSTSEGTVKILTAADGTSILAVEGVALKVNETITIKFKALVNKSLLDATKPLVNNADVYDNFDNTPVPAGETPTSSIKDSTATSGTPTESKVSNDPTDPTQPGGDQSSTVTFTDRSLTLTGSGAAELPPISSSTSPATYTQTITNNGNTAESGLTFTISNPSTTDNITPTNVIYDPTPGVPGDEVTLTPNASGVYTISGSIQPGKTATITYDVVTTDAKIGTSETNTVTLIPASVTGTTAPTVTPANNTTTVQGLKLVKEQALDATCDGTPDTAFAATNITAIPGQCVVYKITATNGLTTKQLTNVVISDDASQWNTKATYVANSIKDSVSGTTTAPGAFAKSSAMTLAANGGSGWLQFAVKINTTTQNSGVSSAQ